MAMSPLLPDRLRLGPGGRDVTALVADAARGTLLGQAVALLASVWALRRPSPSLAAQGLTPEHLLLHNKANLFGVFKRK